MCGTIQKIVVIQHMPHEGLGIIKRGFEGRGASIEYVKVYLGERLPKRLEHGCALIVLGGAMGVYEEDKYLFLKDELRLLESAFMQGLPCLGICLGAQLMAKAAGARVYKGRTKEIGWYKLSLTQEGKRDWLFLGFPDEFTVFQWHGDTFDVPQGASRLAGSELFPNQLLRIGRRSYAFQFHLEITEKMIYEWLSTEENKQELAGLKGVIDPEAIVSETSKNIATLTRYGDTVFSRFFMHNDINNCAYRASEQSRPRLAR